MAHRRLSPFILMIPKFSRPPLARMLKIHEALQRGSHANCSTLAREIEVAVKTIQRDIEFMRDQLGLPVGYDQSRKGYFYTERVTGFPTVQISEGELMALLVAGRAMEQYRGTPYERQLKAAFDKLAAGLNDTISFTAAAIRAVADDGCGGAPGSIRGARGFFAGKLFRGRVRCAGRHRRLRCADSVRCRGGVLYPRTSLASDAGIKGTARRRRATVVAPYRFEGSRTLGAELGRARHRGGPEGTRATAADGRDGFGGEISKKFVEAEMTPLAFEPALAGFLDCWLSKNERRKQARSWRSIAGGG